MKNIIAEFEMLLEVKKNRIEVEHKLEILYWTAEEKTQI